MAATQNERPLEDSERSIVANPSNSFSVYWFRPTLKGLDCDATDTTLVDVPDNSSGNYFKGRPNGWETMKDEVFVVTLLTEAASLTMNVAGNSVSVNVPAGAAINSIGMAPGGVSFSLSRGGTTVLEEASPMKILDHCPVSNSPGHFFLFWQLSEHKISFLA